MVTLAEKSRSDPRVPVVGGLAYVERVRQLPATFTATLSVEPDNRYFRHAIAVLVDGAKVGYIAPEVAVDVFDAISASSAAITCPGRRGLPADHATSGVELLLDPSCIPTAGGS
jgi:hypothetical protein